MNTIFARFNTAVDSFDFSLKKSWNQTYVLEISAMAKGKELQRNAIILDTDQLETAINKSLLVINALAREVAPGVKELGNIAGRKNIKLVPHREQVAPGIYPMNNQVSETEHDDDEIPEFCYACPSFGECFEEEDDEDDYEEYSPFPSFRLVPSQPTVSKEKQVAEELVKALESFIKVNINWR